MLLIHWSHYEINSNESGDMMISNQCPLADCQNERVV